VAFPQSRDEAIQWQHVRGAARSCALAQHRGVSQRATQAGRQRGGVLGRT